MIANHDKFHVLFLFEYKNDILSQQAMDIKGVSLLRESKFTLLKVDVDN